MIAAAALLLAGCSVSRSGSASESSDSSKSSESSESSATTPSATTGDPADIEGIEITEYDAVHAEPGQRVRYEKAPPYGGRHDQTWANCMGTVYDVPVRNENMVHSLEHGAVWIAYDKERVTGGDLERLEDMVDGTPFMMLSPYPDLDRPISLQSWGHQLKLSEADDPRIDEFVRVLRQNRETTPELGATCDTTGFDVTNPPPFETGPLPADAAPVDGP